MNMNLIYTLVAIFACQGVSLSLPSPITQPEKTNLNANQSSQTGKTINMMRTGVLKYVSNLPIGYSVLSGIGAYKLHLIPQTWNNARNICIREGAHLAVLRSRAEENFIKNFQLENNIWHTWLGIHEQFANDDWVTVFDEPLGQVAFAPWNKGEPNHVRGREHCVGYINNAGGTGLNDLDCKKVLPFFCKVDLNY